MMRISTLLVYAWAPILLLFCTGTGAESLAAKVTEVAKGDVLTLTHNETTETVRLHGVDAPELAQPFGPEAKEFTKKLVLGKDVTVDALGKDEAGRTLAKVTLADGRILNHEVVAAGMGWYYEKHTPVDPDLRGLAAKAITEKKGLWSGATPLAPWDFRGDALKAKAITSETPALKPTKGALDAGTIVFVTKSGSDYHRAGCNRLDKTETPLTAGEAEKLGFKPCRTCFSTLLGERKPKASAKGKLEGIPREELPAKPAPGPAKPKVSMLDQYKDNPIMKQLGVSVQKDANGNIRGISADNFSSLPLAGMLGFQNGDMIQSINGETIDSEAKMMDLYNRYKDAPSIDVGIVRNGQPQNMPVNLGSITKMFR